MDNQAEVLSEQNDIEEISEIKMEKFSSEQDDIHDIEVIEVKMVDAEDIFNDVVEYEDSEFIDIANIPVNEDIPEDMILPNGGFEDETFNEEKLDDEEMEILKKDLITRTPGYEHLTESSNTVSKPMPVRVEKVDKVNKSACRICGKLFVTKANYLRHLLKQHSNLAKRKKLPAKNDDSTSVDTSVNEPTITEPRKRKPAPVDEMKTSEMCHICGKIFRHRSTYRQHLRDQHDPNGVKPQKKRTSRMCDLCGKVCSGGTFREHMRKHTNPESVTCEHCGQVFSFVSVLKSHIQVRHNAERPFQCSMCPSSFKRADYLRSHMRYKHEPKLLSAENSSKNQYKCDDCGATFRSSVGLSKHRNLREFKEGEAPRCPTSFKCSVCDMSFKKRNYLALHKRYVHEKNKPFRISEASVGPYKCDKCDRRFASVCGRNYHCKHTHGAAFNTKFSEVCDHCGLTFRNRVFFAKHSAKLRDKPTCYLCWNAFDTQDALKEHVHEVHVDDLPFNCQTCNIRFVTLRQLNDHIRSRHDKIRPFQCHYCPHNAVRKDSLEVHIRSCHLGEKPFKCDLCDKAFSQSSDVRKHRIIHTRNKTTAAITPKEEPAYQPKHTQQKSVNQQRSVTQQKPAKSCSLSTENSVPAKLILRVAPPVENKQIPALEGNASKNKKNSRHRLRICHLCGKNYNTDSGFRHHMVMHRDPSFSCHMCGRVFWESQNLKKHLAALHSDDRPFQCHMCGMNYKRRDVLQEHIKRVHDGVKREWKEAFIKKQRAAPPKPAPVKMIRHQCPYCNKCMSNKGYLKDHINGAHIKKALYKCEECDMTFTRKASYKYHFNRAHILKKRVLEPRGSFLKDCEYCGLQFQVKKYYELHIAGKHFNKYPCEHCGEVFENKFQMTTHLENDHADQVAKCQFCQKTFLENLHLKRHIYLCHNLDRKKYECHECGKTANKKSTLAIHMRRHTGEKPYQCDMCTKRFAQSVDYRKHRAIHFKQKNEQRETDFKDGIVETEEIGFTVECVYEKGNIEYETIKEVDFA